MKTIKDINLKNKTVIVRVDFNVPIQDGIILNNDRVKAAIPTIEHALSQEAKVIIVSHLGRPKEGEYNKDLSLIIIKDLLEKLLNLSDELLFLNSLEDLNSTEIKAGQLALLENIRFFEGELDNSEQLGKLLGSSCDIYVIDCFATAHRYNASISEAAKNAKETVAGLLLEKEVKALQGIFNNPSKPVTAIVGGSKVSTKLELLDHLIESVDTLVLGGGLANTFLLSKGISIGNSLSEASLSSMANTLLSKAARHNTKIILPIDVVVAKQITSNAETRVVDLTKDSICEDDLILDLGPKTIKLIEQDIAKSKTILWNGPLGVFEQENFKQGTKSLSLAIANSNAFSVAGGGETLAAIDMFKIKNNISFVSTGGAAFLAYLEGKQLPGLEYLLLKDH